MADQAALRNTVLMEIYRRSGGDISKPIDLLEAARALGLPANDVALIVGQLEGKALARFCTSPRNDAFTNWTIALTMPGVEEAEKMNRTRIRRFCDENFEIAGAIWSVVILILGVLANRLADIVFKAIGWQ